MSLKDRLVRLEGIIRASFPDVDIEIARQIFAEHAEFRVYVLDKERFPEVRDLCEALEKEELVLERPDIWVLPILWTVPWPGRDREQAMREAQALERRREEFRLRHNLVRATTHE